MKLTIIHPCIGRRGDENYMKTWQMEPLPAATLAGLTPSDIEVVFYDDRIEPLNFDEPTDAVALSVETYTAKRCYQIASEYRKRNVPVIMGGFHASLCPDEVSTYADVVVLGEAESSWDLVIDDLRHGTLKSRYEGQARPSLAGLAPDKSIFKNKKYVPVGLVEFGRGCIYSCEFCAIQTVFNKTQNQRSVDDVIREVKEAASTNGIIFFVDDNFTINKSRTKELLEKLIPLKIRWVSQASIQTSYDDELLNLMYRSGCQCVLVGIESLNQDNLAQMDKSFNGKRGGPAEAMKNFRRHGIPVYGTFMFGYEGDTIESFKETQKFAQDNSLIISAFNHVTPFPGTPLYERLEKTGDLLYDKWWLDDDYLYGMIPHRLKNFDSDELRKHCFDARRTFYGVPSIAKRALAKVNHKNWNIFKTFLIANFMHRGDIRQREFHPLGDQRWQGSLLKVQ